MAGTVSYLETYFDVDCAEEFMSALCRYATDEHASELLGAGWSGREELLARLAYEQARSHFEADMEVSNARFAELMTDFSDPGDSIAALREDERDDR